jgi:hypothetical protein
VLSPLDLCGCDCHSRRAAPISMRDVGTVTPGEPTPDPSALQRAKLGREARRPQTAPESLMRRQDRAGQPGSHVAGWSAPGPTVLDGGLASSAG